MLYADVIKYIDDYFLYGNKPAQVLEMILSFSKDLIPELKNNLIVSVRVGSKGLAYIASLPEECLGENSETWKGWVTTQDMDMIVNMSLTSPLLSDLVKEAHYIKYGK